MYIQKDKKIARQKTCSSAGCIKFKAERITAEKEKVPQQWKEYKGELLHGNRNGKTYNI